MLIDRKSKLLYCESCNEAMNPEDELFDFEGTLMCEECFNETVSAMTPTEIADKMGIPHNRAEYLTDN